MATTVDTSKLNIFAAAGGEQSGVTAAKVIAYAVVNASQLTAAKLDGYAATAVSAVQTTAKVNAYGLVGGDPPAVTVEKFIAYAVTKAVEHRINHVFVNI